MSTNVVDARKGLKQIVIHFRQHKLHPQSGKYVLKNNGGYTVMLKKGLLPITWGQEKNEQIQGIAISVARCGKQDNFNKHVGRAIVEGRMKCERKLLSQIVPQQAAVAYLDRLNNKCKAQYSKEFFERILTKLV